MSYLSFKNIIHFIFRRFNIFTLLFIIYIYLLISSQFNCILHYLLFSINLYFNLFSFRQIVVDDSETVNSILKSIGYVCSSYSKMYTVKPIQIFYHIPNINDYNPYINYFTPKKLSNVCIFLIFLQKYCFFHFK